MPSADHRVHVAIDSRFENIELVQIVLDDTLRRLDCDDDTRYWVGIAVREAVANAIKHGNSENPQKKVRVDFEVEDERIEIRVLDEGEGFDPHRVGDPLDPENILKPNGRGIFYMNKFMDEIVYDFGPSGGTQVILRKRISPEEMAEQEER